MTGAQVAQLILAFGPAALDIIESLIANWDREMTPDELREFCVSKRKSREEWIDWAKTQLGKQ